MQEIVIQQNNEKANLYSKNMSVGIGEIVTNFKTKRRGVIMDIKGNEIFFEGEDGHGYWCNESEFDYQCCMDIKIPKCFMNCCVTTDGYFCADTNDSENWDTIKFKLPNGKWRISSYSADRTVVQLVKIKKTATPKAITTIINNTGLGGKCRI